MSNEVKEVWNSEWSQSIQKARQNLDVAEMLFNQGFISLSAFHVQQCVELAIKATAYKSGFKQHLENTRATKSHIPSRGLISEVYNFVEDQLKTIDQSKFDSEFGASITEAMRKLKQFTSLLCQAEKQHNEKFTELWLHSLGMDTSERVVTALDGYKKSFNTTLAQQLAAGTFVLAREFLIKLVKLAYKNRQGQRVQSAKNKIREIFLKHGLTDKLVDAFFNTESKFKKIMSSEIDRHGLVNMIDLLLKPNGILHECNDIRHPKLPKLNINECIKFIWIAHLATISPTVILLYPHVIIGRYPKIVNVKAQNSKTIPKYTEDLYSEHNTAILEFINEAKSIMDRVQMILDMRTSD